MANNCGIRRFLSLPFSKIICFLLQIGKKEGERAEGSAGQCKTWFSHHFLESNGHRKCSWPIGAAVRRVLSVAPKLSSPGHEWSSGDLVLSVLPLR